MRFLDEKQEQKDVFELLLGVGECFIEDLQPKVRYSHSRFSHDSRTRIMECWSGGEEILQMV